MDVLLGIVMLYSWIHGSIIVAKKVRETTQYENVVLIVAGVGLLLTVIGLAID